MDDIPEPFASVLVAITKYLDDPQRGGQFYERDIRSLHIYNINLALARAGINWLIESKYLIPQIEKRSSDEEPVIYFEFSASAAVYIYSRISKTGPETYLPLPLNPESADVLQAIEATEQVVEAIRGNNGLSEDIRSSLVSALKSGLDVVKASFPTREQIEIMLVRPLNWIAKYFAQAAIGELAKQAVTLIKGLF